MSQPLQLAAADRVLVIAPHPDDESIACGGLLLAARDAGAAAHVVTLTDGDNNPWPQRWIEKRWRIDAVARARWGARRREEAQAALDLLGVATQARIFFGLPDAALTAILMRDANRLVGPLRAQIAAFAPTQVAFPGLADRHPDHSATHIAARLALLAEDRRAQQLTYCVHGDAQAPGTHVVELGEPQRAIKHAAIASHRTQMALSGKRFLAYATPHEAYAGAVVASRDEHPLRASLRTDGAVTLRVARQNLHGNDRVSILLGGAQGTARVCHFRLAPSQRAEVIDAHDDRAITTIEWRGEAAGWTAELRLPVARDPAIGFARLARAQRGLVIFDRYGWQPIERG
ncbi:MAG: PIG-L family deacetylase [Proteobacteria bacterium]|uniref:PIG-L deacetylase family protein n=1 Tax=Rudaea sp. TaxID=2136325 RepID=UPI001D45309E|nr:PIG-L family deacetylase [Pseudomonadota bacterium]MBS0566514.1 PIG-L family deacetylase [Pseudomonadota bacterium]